MPSFRRLLYKAAMLYWRFAKPIVLGSRAIVVRDGQVLLVRLTYTAGWYLPGGGVNRGEGFRAGVIRELKEECALEPVKMSLFGVYHTSRHGKIDHVAIYVISDFKELLSQPADPEIAEMRYFPLTALPKDATPATRRRINEYLVGAPSTDAW
jgi:ADP-ribose pyrophosphatase YjhB (NUDIX family)